MAKVESADLRDQPKGCWALVEHTQGKMKCHILRDWLSCWMRGAYGEWQQMAYVLRRDPIGPLIGTVRREAGLHPAITAFDQVGCKPT